MTEAAFANTAEGSRPVSREHPGFCLLSVSWSGEELWLGLGGVIQGSQQKVGRGGKFFPSGQ